MIEEFEFPDTGEGVTEGKFLEWKVKEGEEIEEDQILGEAETDKAVVEIPSSSTGTVKELRAEPGDTVKVGEVIMTIETDQNNEKSQETNKKDSSKNKEKETVNETNASKHESDVLALPKVRKLAKEKNIDISEIEYTGNRVTVEDLENNDETPSQTKEKTESTSTTETTGVKARPSVRKLAREKDIDINKIEGTGRNNEVTRNDVLNYFEEEKSSTKNQKSVENKSTLSKAQLNDSVEHNKVEKEEIVEEELTQTKKVIGKRMSKSKYNAPHVTHVEKVDVTKLVKLRENEKEKVDVHLTYLPFIMKACVDALKDYPVINSELDEKNDKILKKQFYDFNIAVDTERGLLVPLIESVDEKSIVDLAEEITSVASKAKEGNLGREDMKTGSFSITNLGVIGGETFTPIINYPQAAILGIGKIQETAEVVDGEVKPRNTVKLSLSYDHRLIDGATAARFVNKIKEDLEDPEELMVKL